MIKKSLYILSVLLLSSTVQIQAMQSDEEIEEEYEKNNETTQILDKISNIIDKSKLDKTKKEEILSNINKINDKYALHWIYNVIDILPGVEKTEETLLNIIKGEINDINTLRETVSLFNNIIQNKEMNDIFFFYSIKSISQMSNYELYALSKVLDILPEVTKTEDTFFNLSMMDYNTLVSLYLVLYYLKDAEKIENTLLNIIDMDKDSLDNLCGVLYELPKEGKTKDILHNISKMNRDTLKNLYNVLYRIQYKLKSYITQDILHNISEMNEDKLSDLNDILYMMDKTTTYNLFDISKMGKYQLRELYEKLYTKKMKNKKYKMKY